MDDNDKKKRTKQTPMSEDLPTVLLPEADDPTVASLRQDLEQRDPNQALGVNVRFEEGMPLEQAADMLDKGEVDILIAGQKHGSPEVLRTALDLNIRERDRSTEENPEKKRLTSFFIMEKEGSKTLYFADCAVNESPTPGQLVTIAEQTCASVQNLNDKPVVAFLSLSTFGSASGSSLKGVAAVREAAQLFKEKHPEIASYGEIQADAAIDPEIFAKKAEKAGIELKDGQMPNVFVFPDGQSGNIAYKLLEKLGGYQAVGPMLDGTAKNMHDLSRGGTKEALLRSVQVAGELFKARKAAAQAHEGTERPAVPTQ